MAGEGERLWWALPFAFCFALLPSSLPVQVRLSVSRCLVHALLAIRIPSPSNYLSFLSRSFPSHQALFTPHHPLPAHSSAHRRTRIHDPQFMEDKRAQGAGIPRFFRSRSPTTFDPNHDLVTSPVFHPAVLAAIRLTLATYALFVALYQLIEEAVKEGDAQT